MKQPQKSVAGKASWKSRTKKGKNEHIKKMNEARIKTMQENKRDAEAYRKLKLQGLKIK